MKREKRSFSKNVLRDYFKKALTILPLTFLFAPLFTVLLGYHPEVKYLNFLAYLCCAFFIYFGMTLTIILPKHKNLAFPVIAAAAFFFRNIMEIPALGVVNYVKDSAEIMPGVFETEMIAVDMLPADWLYLSVIIFASTLIAGIIGAFYARQSALDFVSRRNMIFFVNIIIISGIVFYLAGGSQIINMYVICLVCFIVSYFLVRNFAHLNRQLEVYAERGAYNVSGTKKIYAYYFASLLFLLPLPFVICFFIVPYIANILETAVNFIIACIFGLILLSSEPPEVTPPDNIPEPTAEPSFLVKETGNDMIVFYILLVIFVIILIIFRKHIKQLILSIIEYFKRRYDKFDAGKNIINQEIISDIKKDKKIKTSYRDYLKKARKIKGLPERFLFAYNYIFWGIIRKDENLKESATPNEVAVLYEDTREIAGLYQDLKYGRKSEENGEVLSNMTVKAENFIREFL